MNPSTLRFASLALIASALSLPLAAQTKPCVAMNDQSTSASAAVTVFAFAGPGGWAVQYTPTATQVVHGMRIYTGNKFSDASMKLEVWSHDATNKVPKAPITGGTWKNPKPTSQGWYGANFDKIVIMTKGTTYWLVWTEPGFSNVPVEPNGKTLPFARRAGTGAWTGGGTWALKFRLYCSLLDVKNVQVFGPSCNSAAGERGTAFTNTEPSVGNASFRLEGTGLPSSAAALLALGFDKNYKSVSLGSAAPGCSLNTDILAVFASKTGSGDVRKATPDAHVSYSLPIPNNASLKGLFVGAQIAVADKQSKNQLPLVFTNGLRVTVF